MELATNAAAPSQGRIPLRTELFWITILWFGFALLDSMQGVITMRSEGMHHNWYLVFAVSLSNWIPWAIASPFILRLARKLPFPRKSAWAAHIVLCLLIVVVFASWTSALSVRFNPYSEKADSMRYTHLLFARALDYMLFSAILYGIVLSIDSALESRRRLALQQTETARLNEQLSRAQLDALRRQIEPHFLFNTLNSVSGLVREGRNDAAVNMIAGLSDLLRRSFDDAPHQQVPLSEEIEFAQKYIDIQKMRFTDRLRVSMDIPSELYLAQVPSLILQPMVENAIKHGIAHRAQGGSIHITASRSNGTLTLRVANDGPSLHPNWESTRGGIGIANVRTRLSSLYGEASALTLSNQPTGVEVALSLPYIVTPHAEA